jgi:hypothetical protein
MITIIRAETAAAPHSVIVIFDALLLPTLKILKEDVHPSSIIHDSILFQG